MAEINLVAPLQGVKGRFPAGWVSSVGHYCIDDGAGRNGLSNWQWGIGVFARADNGYRLGRVESCHWAIGNEIRFLAYSWQPHCCS